jgi:4-diphosphocytidyl-2-C-methyl-D-erythritol kinase
VIFQPATAAGLPESPSPGVTIKAIFDVAAPAKLNVFLHVVGRRPDGYHLLQSVFMLIDWCDTLHFELRTDGRITREDLPGESSETTAAPLPADDLTVRAAQALQRATGTSLGVHIGLVKRIPSSAGMGGGSSDAASCLLALQRLWGVRLAPDQLQSLALSLGADVPFFLSSGHAWVEGIGEQVTPISLPAAQFLVAKPPEGASTPQIFGAPLLKRDTQAATIQGFAANAQKSQTSGASGAKAAVSPIWKFGRNDLQAVAQLLCPPISQTLGWLADQGLEGRMTGSGSAVFAPLPAGHVLGTAPSGWAVRQCSNLAVHPLAGW